VATAKPLKATKKIGKQKRCARAIGEALVDRGTLAGVTIAVRLDEAARARLDGLKIAEQWAREIAAGGVPAERISKVVPAIVHGQEGTVHVTYSDSAAQRPVLSIESMSGDVSAGPSTKKLSPAKPGVTLPVGSVVKVESGAAWLALAEGSRLRLTEGTTVQVEELRYDESLRRVVRIQLLEGDLEADVRAAAAGSIFDLVSPGGTAAVRGTVFRMSVSRKRRTRLETLAGRVDLNGKKGQVSVAAGQGAAMEADGNVGNVRDLLPAPEVAGPRLGALKRDELLRWAEVNGADQYRVELARDAEFALEPQKRGSKKTDLGAAKELPDGKWFWRVAAVDGDEFVGRSSKVYAFKLNQ
jgi:hypothetical protein